MKTNRGKGYFHAMGTRDKAKGNEMKDANALKQWPLWAMLAYEHGYFGIHWR